MSGELALISKGLPAMNFIRADSDVDLGTTGYCQYHLFGQEFYLTTTHVSLIIVCVTLIVFAIFANRAIKKADPYKAPGMFLNIVEMIAAYSVDSPSRNGVQYRGFELPFVEIGT